MKILWMVNITLPEAADALGLTKSFTGGWLSGLVGMLKKTDNELTVVSFSGAVTEDKTVKLENTEYIVLSCREDEEAALKKVVESKAPDIVHIHGTEMSHSLAMLNAAKGYKTVVSIQGLAYMCAKHFYADLPKRFEKINPIKSLLLRLFRTGGSFVAYEQGQFADAGEREKRLISMATNFIGRTGWDKEHVLAVNKTANYFKCNEILRDAFYTDDSWHYAECEPNTIFATQGHYPIKGLHILLKAVKIVKSDYPNVKLYITGKNLFENLPVGDNRFVAHIMYEYADYIDRLIKRYHLKDNVVYMGALDERQIKSAYLNANVFVLPSAIENSSNSLGEAMMLGMPCIASRVGGIPDMIVDREEGILYDFGDAERLADEIVKMFQRKESAEEFGRLAKKHAQKTHSKHDNAETLLSIYNLIYSEAR